MLNLAHWRLVVSIADAGTISRAAEDIGMTQSGASQALAQLEKHLGMKIFSRSHRQMVVTAFGEQVVEHARHMLMHHCAIRDLASSLGGPGSARLKLGSFPSIISTLLPALLRGFHQRYPNIEVVALEGTDDEVENWLAHQHIDFGVVLNPEPERHAIVLGHATEHDGACCRDMRPLQGAGCAVNPTWLSPPPICPPGRYSHY